MNHGASPPPPPSCRGRAKQCRQVFRSQTATSAWYLVKERRADVAKEDRVVTGGAAITQESRGEEKQLWGGSLRYRKNVKLSLHRNFIDWPLFEEKPGSSLNMGKGDSKLGIKDDFTFHCSILALFIGGRGLSWLSNCECWHIQSPVQY